MDLGRQFLGNCYELGDKLREVLDVLGLVVADELDQQRLGSREASDGVEDVYQCHPAAECILAPDEQFDRILQVDSLILVFNAAELRPADCLLQEYVL